MTIAFDFFSEEETLLGIRLSKYNFCVGEDGQGNLNINSYYDLSFGLLFFIVCVTIQTGETMKIKKGS